MNIPDIPNYHALAMLCITIIALYFFRREDIPLETSSLAVLVILCLVFTIFPFAFISLCPIFVSKSFKSTCYEAANRSSEFYVNYIDTRCTKRRSEV